MIRMRTISEAAEHLKNIDPETRVTSWTIRTLVKAGDLEHVRIGSRILINLDRLESFLQSPPQYNENESHSSSSGIRRINL